MPQRRPVCVGTSAPIAPRLREPLCRSSQAALELDRCEEPSDPHLGTSLVSRPRSVEHCAQVNATINSPLLLYLGQFVSMLAAQI